jgi:hypothetical protein
MDDESHALEPFLTKRLTELGLDYETYGPYVLPFLTDFEHADEDEWESVMELLQASSETHSDDEQAWKDLRVDIDEAWKTHRDAAIAAEMQELEHHAQERKEILERDRQLAAEAAILEEEKKSKPVGTSEVVDEAKRALIARFAFEDDGEDEQDEEAPLTNQQVAVRASQERSKEEKNKHVITKKEEQQKTSADRMDKAKLKEERRQRSTKQERKR